MGILAFGNGLIQVVVIVVALRIVASERQRQVIVTVSASALAASFAGLLLLVFGVTDDEIMPALKSATVWSVYLAFGAGVLYAIWRGLSASPVRFRWKQRRAAAYWQNYKRLG